MEEKIKKKVRYTFHPKFLQDAMNLKSINSMKVLFFLIDKMSSDHEQKSWWSRKKIATHLKVSGQTILNSMEELIKLDFISVQKRFDAETGIYQTNIYRVNPRFITKVIESVIYIEENEKDPSQSDLTTSQKGLTTPPVKTDLPPSQKGLTQSIILNEHLDLKNSSEVNYVEEKNLENSTENLSIEEFQKEISTLKNLSPKKLKKPLPDIPEEFMENFEKCLEIKIFQNESNKAYFQRLLLDLEERKIDQKLVVEIPKWIKLINDSRDPKYNFRIESVRSVYNKMPKIIQELKILKKSRDNPQKPKSRVMSF